MDLVTTVVTTVRDQLSKTEYPARITRRLTTKMHVYVIPTGQDRIAPHI